MPSRPARDKGCERRSCTTYNAACGIETTRSPRPRCWRTVAPHTMLRAALKPRKPLWLREQFPFAPHTMLRAALKLFISDTLSGHLQGCTTYNAACGIETDKNSERAPSKWCCTTYNAACGIETGIFRNKGISSLVAPHTMLCAALKPGDTFSVPPHSSGCTTYNAACGIETSSKKFELSRSLLHHIQCCVRH